MVRIVPKNAPIRFECDGHENTCGQGIETPHHEFMKAFEYMQRKGWKAFVEEGVWNHACPRCYVDWCRRAGVQPYETSVHTTYDEVNEEEGVGHYCETLEPDWWVERERAKQEKTGQLRLQKARRNRARNKRKQELSMDDSDPQLERLYSLPYRYRDSRY